MRGPARVGDREHSSSTSSMDGVPFTISEKFACTATNYEYSFRTEHSAAARLPPSPTRSQPCSES
ncbi:hypothetical protein JZ751_001295 [Albula glossodonta]|uniref:Uncharacterized protein n=1 Tax=Albula glossodonta TaxID=121402 RepID=A0A8T2PT31_9TELE|nr:hypothetical protein JZ751_001295 [Albula glossodonta]